MNKQFINYINTSMNQPAPRSATYWRRWASQAEIPLSDREAILSNFRNYIHKEMSNQEMAETTIRNVTHSLESFWSLVDACTVNR
jgi:hypothetical protein